MTSPIDALKLAETDDDRLRIFAKAIGRAQDIGEAICRQVDDPANQATRDTRDRVHDALVALEAAENNLLRGITPPLNFWLDDVRKTRTGSVT